MQIGMIGLGRMGANMVRRLQAGGHECVVYDVNPDAVKALTNEGARGTGSFTELVAALKPPRAIWLMLPAAIVDTTILQLREHLHRDDILIDGGNTHYVDDIRRAQELMPFGIHYVDVGTSGGVWGLERGYCLMIGGEAETVGRLDAVLRTLAPGNNDIPPAASVTKAAGTAELGYLHCGPAGAGHFVKMVHNGIEYGLMAAYAEGFNVMHRANIGHRDRAADAETAPLRHPEHYQYDFDLAAISELWRRGSVVASWLLDLSARALAESPDLGEFSAKISDSDEGRWTIAAAIDEGTPAPVLTAALYQRFASRGEDAFACRLLSAMRYQFGGHR